jgi:hypothetical protein
MSKRTKLMHEERIKRAIPLLKMYMDGMTLQEIGDMHGVSRERIRQLIKPFGYKKPYIEKPKKSELDKYQEWKDRFNSRIEIKNNGCWEWNGPRVAGYGRVGFNGKDCYAHRIQWVIQFGDIPDNLYVLHKCDNRPCVNPDHLYLGTAKDNARDREERNPYRHGRKKYS